MPVVTNVGRADLALAGGLSGVLKAFGGTLVDAEASTDYSVPNADETFGGVKTNNERAIFDLAANPGTLVRQIEPALTSVHDDVFWGEGATSFFDDRNGGSYNQVWSTGWNCNGNGATLDPTLIMFRDGWEYRWQSSPGVYQSERHVGEITFPGSPVQTIRPYTFNVYHGSRLVTHTFSGSSLGILDETNAYQIHSLSHDPTTHSLTAEYRGNNVVGYSFNLGQAGDTLSFGRAASADVQMGITGQTVQFDLANNTSTATLRLLNGSNDLEILAGGNLGISIDGPTSAVSLPGSLAVTGSITGTIAQSQITGLSASLGAKADLTANQTLSGLNKFTSPIWAKLTTGGGPNGFEVRGTSDALIGFWDSNGNITVGASGGRVTLGANKLSLSHDASNGRFQNNVGSFSVANPVGVVAIELSVGNAVVFDTTTITFRDAYDLVVGTTTGAKIGTSASQKLGFYGATPIVRPTMGAATAGGTYTATEQAMLQAAYNALRNLGLGS